MPYFERKTWLEMVGDLPKVAQPDAATVADRDEPGIADIARSVLLTETGPQHALDGPYRCREILTPGQRGSVTLEVSADRSGGTLTLDISPGDLRSRGGSIIPANKIDIRPAHLAIAPGSSTQFVVEILVPLEADSGQYIGRITGRGPEPVDFLIEVEVGTNKM